MEIKDHWLTGEGVIRVPTAHTSGYIKPRIGIIHDTTSRIAAYPLYGSVVKYLKKNSRRVSYHYVIERSGRIVVMAPANRKCHHAGRSSYEGDDWCNGFSVAIGLVSPGPLKGSVESAKAWFGKRFGRDDGTYLQGSPYHGNSKLWLRYTKAQKESLAELCELLKNEYGLKEFVGHYSVSPGRKVDPAPMIELGQLGIPGLEAPDPDAPPVPKVASADKTLKKKSREYATATWASRVLKGVVTGGATYEGGKALGIDNINAMRTYADTVKGFIADYGLIMFVVICFGGVIAFELIKRWKRQSYDDGFYEPSGDAVTKPDVDEDLTELNEAGGDWK